MRFHVPIVAIFDRYIDADTIEEARDKAHLSLRSGLDPIGFPASYQGTVQTGERSNLEADIDRRIVEG